MSAYSLVDILMFSLALFSLAIYLYTSIFFFLNIRLHNTYRGHRCRPMVSDILSVFRYDLGKEIKNAWQMYNLSQTIQ